ncbi:hypothetical protein ANANG_G00106800 [Anguilla anguilla]|uniref:Metalloendopeptidase n=1 Tax=Anguilla anguilla TaxID=7936 RepID=A0A9D3MHP3_ANGAN|nr:hypothetical protein ANANG_G00106800 [Anguilla anguilla]
MCPMSSPTNTHPVSYPLLSVGLSPLLPPPAYVSYAAPIRETMCTSSLKTVQHELLHALGFNHEQTRSDRDNHIRVLLQNVVSGMEHNFNRIDTNNLATPYDYNSVMQYHRYAFSKNNQPTMVPIPNNNVEIGAATQMSYNDILRINRLYQCCAYSFCQNIGFTR